MIHSNGRGRFALACSVVLAAGALAACGTDSDGGSGDADGCGYAFVFQDPTANSTAQQTIQRGLEQAQEEHSVTIDIVDGTGVAQVADNLRAAASKGCYEAIGTAFFAVGEVVTEVAQEFPDQEFFILSGAAEGPNVYNYTPANEQGTYVAGAMAAALSESGTIGIVLGDTSPALLRFSAGYQAGAKSVDPDIEVLESSVGSFTDAAKAGAVASSQSTQDADLIYSAAGANLEVYFQAADKGYQVIASDLSDYAAAQSRDPDVAFVAAEAADEEARYAITQFVDGTAEPGSNELGLAEGVFHIPYVTDDGTDDYTLPDEVVAAGKEAYEAVVDGSVEVPTS